MVGYIVLGIVCLLVGIFAGYWIAKHKYVEAAQSLAQQAEAKAQAVNKALKG